MKGISRILGSLLFLGFLGFVVGCAVLRVDVDVYKGPMANHEDVQTEQLAAIAMGAKPLLVQLRSVLNGTSTASRDWEQDSLVSSDNAKRVNDVLSLYKDIESLIDLGKIKSTKTAYEQATENLENLDRPSMQTKLQPQQPSISTTLITKVQNYLDQKETIDQVKTAINDVKKQISTDIKNRDNTEEKRGALTKVLATTNDLQSACNPLYGGRLPQGLERLINDYHKEKYDDVTSSTSGEVNSDVKNKRRILVDALVHFAEKVLFTANNGVLLENNRNSECCEKISTNILVLQAVGNSILIQADEFQQRASYKRKIEDEGEKKNELLAMRQATTPEPKEVLDALVKKVKASAAQEKKEYEGSKEKLDKEIMMFKAGEFKGEYANIGGNLYENFQQDYNKFCGSVTAYTEEKKLERETVIKDFEKLNAAYEIFKDDSFQKYLIDNTKGKASMSLNVLYNIITAILEKESGRENSQPRLDNLNLAKRGVVDLKDQFAKTDPQNFEATRNMTVKIMEDQTLSKKNEKDKDDRLLKAVEGIAVLAEKCKLAKDSEPKYNNAYLAIQGATGGVLAKFDSAEGRPSPSGVYWQLLFVLEGKLKDAVTPQVAAAPAAPPVTPTPAEVEAEKKKQQQQEEITKFKDALAYVNEYTKSIDVKVFDNANKDVKGVFDQMMALLRHQHIQAVKEHGATSPTATQLEDAIKLAYNYRSNMVYIRPPSAYLRSSFPSTSLQSDPQLVWENMLSKHAWHNMPFLGAMHKPSTKQKAKIVAELDKQYWQNINSVRVAGAGNTNYVIAKDDVGNWYVKRYSADTKDIIKSAQKLAMFNMGSTMKLDLVGRLNKLADNPEATQQDTQDASKPLLERVFGKYSDEYNKQTVNNYQRLIDILTVKAVDNTNTSTSKAKSTIESQIEQAWSNNEDTNKADINSKLKEKLTLSATHLDSARNELPANPDEKKDGEEIRTRAERIMNALREIKRFHNVLITEIRSLKLASAPLTTLEEKKGLKNDADKALADATKIEGEKKSARDEASKNLAIKKDALAEWEIKKKVATDLLAKNPDDTALQREKADADARDEDAKKAVNDYTDGALKKSTDAENVYVAATAKVTDTKTILAAAETAVKSAQESLDSAIRAEQYAIQSATDIGRSVLTDMLDRRIDVVGDYETGIMFIGDAIKENK